MKNNIFKLLPIFFGFFVMGFVDIVGISTNYVKQDFGLNNTLATFLPFMVFLWFAILSLPSGIFMSRIGRKNTVQISFVITAVALILPFLWYSYLTALIAFALLGIGNTILQVSMNPLVTNVVSMDKLPSSITFGQTIKAVASFCGPLGLAFAFNHFGDWKLFFLFYAAISVISFIWLGSVKIEREASTEANVTLIQCLKLLSNNYILLMFLGILFIVGVDVGLNTFIPDYISKRCNLPLKDTGYGTSLYFAAKTAGTFIGTFLLLRFPIRTAFRVTSVLAVLAMIGLIFSSELWTIITSIIFVGLACSNVFSIIFSMAIKVLPNKTNEISGLMIMGVAGGAFVLLMGFVSDVALNISDYLSLITPFLVLLICLIYVLILSFSLKTEENK